MRTLKILTISLLPVVWFFAGQPFVQAASVPAGAGVSDGLKQEQSAVEAQRKQWLETLGSPALPPAETGQGKEVPVLGNEDLINRPELMHGLMAQALNSYDLHLLESLTSVYRKQPQANPVLLARAEAAIARLKGDYGRAVRAYRSLNENDPEDKRIALDMAAVLFEDRQWRESDGLFAKTAAAPDLPEEVLNNIGAYRREIAAAQKWRIRGGASITHDKNVNDAAPAYCLPLGCVEQKAENATGIRYQVSAEKNTPLKGHHNIVFRSHMSGVSYYFDKKSQYDNAFGRAYLGWQYQNARTTFNILPFYQWQLAGTDEWSNKTERNRTLNMDMLAHAAGVQTALSHQITPRLQGFVSAETYRQNYREQERAERNDGRHYSLYGSLAYRLSPAHTVFAGWGGGVLRTEKDTLAGRSNNAGNTRHSINGGWWAAWPKLGGLGTQLQLSYTGRRYRGQALDTDFEWMRQRNHETAYSFSLAHPKLSVAKLTPKLTWEHQRTRSTHKWAERKQNRVFVEIEKTF